MEVFGDGESAPTRSPSKTCCPCSTLHTRIIDRLTCCEYLFDSKLPSACHSPIRRCRSSPCCSSIVPIFSLYYHFATRSAAVLRSEWKLCGELNGATSTARRHRQGQRRRVDSPLFRLPFIERLLQKINWIFFIYSKQAILGLLFIFNFVVNSSRQCWNNCSNWKDPSTPTPPHPPLWALRRRKHYSCKLPNLLFNVCVFGGNLLNRANGMRVKYSPFHHPRVGG